MYIMVEGIDGCGKDSVIEFFLDVAKEKNLKVFNAVSYAKQFGALPRIDELSEFTNADVVFTGEPTHAWVGKGVREEIIRTGTNYSAQFTAEQYAVDRFLHYSVLVLPALKAGKVVIQSRGAPTSFCYQPIQSKDPILLENVTSLSGNQLALANQPDILFIVKADADVAMTRLNLRSEKKDNTFFEKLDFLKKAQKRYEGKEIIPKLFDKSEIIYFDNNQISKVDLIKKAKDFAKKRIFT